MPAVWSPHGEVTTRQSAVDWSIIPTVSGPVWPTITIKCVGRNGSLNVKKNLPENLIPITLLRTGLRWNGHGQEVQINIPVLRMVLIFRDSEPMSLLTTHSPICRKILPRMIPEIFRLKAWLLQQEVNRQRPEVKDRHPLYWIRLQVRSGTANGAVMLVKISGSISLLERVRR